MTSGGLARVYAVLIAVVAFLVAWAAVAAHPWRETAKDPRAAALAERRAQLQHEAAQARRVLARRYAAYRVALREREGRIARVRVEQARLDALAASAWARYRASAPVRTITVTTPASPAAPAQSTAQTAALASAPAPSSAPTPASPAPAPAPAPPPPAVVSIPPVTVTQTS